MMLAGKLKAIVKILSVAVLASGCAPQFIEVVSAPEKRDWVEREATIESAQIGSVSSKEIVYGKPLSNVIGPNERVRWISGVDVGKSRLQRTQERLVPAGESGNFSSVESRSSLVEVHQFGIRDDHLNVEGMIALEKFKANSTARYYVEFLSSGAMTESTVNSMLAAWKALSAKLKERGLNISNVVMGGSKYNQQSDSIVLVKVGR